MTIDVKLTAVYLKVPEGYIGFVQELPGANTQGETLEEAKANLEEAINLVLETNRALAEESLQGQEVIREAITISAA
jgi:predicted RNase H-like HicB family nuclease